MDELDRFTLRTLQTQIAILVSDRSVAIAMPALIAELARVVACVDIPDSQVRPLLASVMGQFQEAVAKARAARIAPKT